MLFLFTTNCLRLSPVVQCSHHLCFAISLSIELRDLHFQPSSGSTATTATETVSALLCSVVNARTSSAYIIRSDLPARMQCLSHEAARALDPRTLLDWRLEHLNAMWRSIYASEELPASLRAAMSAPPATLRPPPRPSRRTQLHRDENPSSEQPGYARHERPTRERHSPAERMSFTFILNPLPQEEEEQATSSAARMPMGLDGRSQASEASESCVPSTSTQQKRKRTVSTDFGHVLDRRTSFGEEPATSIPTSPDQSIGGLASSPIRPTVGPQGLLSATLLADEPFLRERQRGRRLPTLAHVSSPQQQLRSTKRRRTANPASSPQTKPRDVCRRHAGARTSAIRSAAKRSRDKPVVEETGTIGATNSPPPSSSSFGEDWQFVALNFRVCDGRAVRVSRNRELIFNINK